MLNIRKLSSVFLLVLPGLIAFLLFSIWMTTGQKVSAQENRLADFTASVGDLCSAEELRI